MQVGDYETSPQDWNQVVVGAETRSGEVWYIMSFLHSQITIRTAKIRAANFLKVETFLPEDAPLFTGKH